MSQRVQMSRRNLFRGASLVSIATMIGCSGETEYVQNAKTQYEVWGIRAEQLEAAGVYSRVVPGKWSEKIEVHEPVVSISGGYVTADINHVMSKEHWITTVYFKDQSGVVFHLEELLPTYKREDMADGVRVYAPIPKGVKEVAVFAYCNLHDHWWSDYQPVT